MSHALMLGSRRNHRLICLFLLSTDGSNDIQTILTWQVRIDAYLAGENLS